MIEDGWLCNKLGYGKQGGAREKDYKVAGKKPLGVMEMFISKIAGIVSQVYSYIKNQTNVCSLFYVNYTSIKLVKLPNICMQMV